MRKIGLLLGVILLMSTHIIADSKCVCKEFQKSNPDQQALIRSLESTDFPFAADISTNSVRGVVGASYFYCENDQGFLLVQLNDEELLYKDVPLQTWFEFKFSNEHTSFYKERIKYHYISI